MSIAAYLQTELVALSNEARRKHPEIKEVPSALGRVSWRWLITYGEL